MWTNFIHWMENKDLDHLKDSGYIDYPIYEVLEETREGIRVVFFTLLTLGVIAGMVIGKVL